VNLTFLIEGEEECNSDGLVEALHSNLHWFEGTDLILLSNSVWLGKNRVSSHHI
jgi:Cys-Gly metallodipeptidase DUG1